MAGQIYSIGWSDEPFLIKNNPPDFKLDGFEFICWNTKPDGKGKNIYPNERHSFQVDTTLYAQWKQIYKYMQLVEIGDVDVASNIALKFNTKSGFRTPMYLNWTSSSSFELLLKITTSDDINTKQIIYRMGNEYKCNLCLFNSRLYIESCNATSTTTFNTNTTYFLKIIKNGVSVDIYSSTDNEKFSLVLNTKMHDNVTNQYFHIGQSYEFTETYTETYQVSVVKTRIDSYKSEYRWHTKQACWYDPDAAYELRVTHATTNKPGSNSCGSWVLESIPVYKTYTELVDKQRQSKRQVVVAGFTGQIDFNESYFIIEKTKYKLKV